MLKKLKILLKNADKRAKIEHKLERDRIIAENNIYYAEEMCRDCQKMLDDLRGKK